MATIITQERIDALLESLGACEPVSFAGLTEASLPRAAAGAYTIWRGTQLIYVGMAGRGLDEAGVARHAENGARKGLADRLNSHASGRRSGDQFCVYVADRFVLPALTPGETGLVGAGQLSLDARVREFIRGELQVRFVVTRDGPEASAVERAVRNGALAAGKPLLNPL